MEKHLWDLLACVLFVACPILYWSDRFWEVVGSTMGWVLSVTLALGLLVFLIWALGSAPVVTCLVLILIALWFKFI